MASLALGVAGAAIGSFFGPLGTSVGWALGAGIGNWLGGGKDTAGPTLKDLKLQNASYGAAIPRGYGTKRIAGNVIDQSDLDPHEHEEKVGGKGGGGTSTTTTYSASLLIQLCETSYIDGNGALVNTPIIGIKRIWAAGRLIYGAGSPSTIVPMTVYYGTEDQLPDPTFEALRGVGNVPPYLGKAYVVFEDWDLTQFGNAIPPLEFEVQFTGNIGLEYYSLWPVDWSFPEDGTSYSYPSGLSGVDYSVAGQVTMHRYRSGQNYPAPYDPSTSVFYESRTFDLNGNFLSSVAQTSIPLSNYTGPGIYASMNNGIAYAHWHTLLDCRPWLGPNAYSTDVNTFAWMKDGEVTYTPALDIMCSASAGDGQLVGELFGGSVDLNIYQGGVFWNGNYYVPAGNGGTTVPSIKRFPAPDGAVYTPDHDAEFDLAPYTTDSVTVADFDLVIGNDGYLYCNFANTGTNVPPVIGGVGIKLLKFDADLNLLDQWFTTDAGVGSSLGQPGYSSVVIWNGYYVTYEVIFGQPQYRMYRMGPSSMTFIDSIVAEPVYNGDSPPVGQTLSALIHLQGTAYGAFRGGILTFGSDFITLGEIVADVSKQVGYTSSQYDVSELTDLVRGYVIAERMTARTAIDALRPIYQFGAVESNLTVKFKKWTGVVDVTIPDEDLGARPFEDDEVERDEWTRALESELPRSIDLLYCNVDMDYQDGHVTHARQVTESELDATVTAPVAMTPEEATRAQQMLLLNAWVERDKYKTPLPRKYLYLEPTDVIAVRGIARRLVNKEEQGYTHVTFDGVAAVTSVFVTAPAAAPPLGFVPQPVPVPNRTDMVLLDSPLVTDADSQVGFNVAMAGRNAGTWPSGALFKSVDGGVNYAGVFSTSAASTFGVATTVLGDFTGGNVFDELNTVHVRLTAGSGSLSSSNRLGVLNGMNLAILGSEVFQFRNAELISVLGSTKTYLLSGLLRGRRGTEWATGTHYTEDVFVLLPVTNVVGAFDELGNTRWYKAVTTGATLASASVEAFVNTGVALKPYAPVSVGGGRNAAGDITINWHRRTRIGGAWSDNVDVPLSEDYELYLLNFYTSSTFSTIVYSDFASSETYAMSAADQTLNFGGLEDPLYLDVQQAGAYGYGYAAQATI